MEGICRYSLDVDQLVQKFMIFILPFVHLVNVSFRFNSGVCGCNHVVAIPIDWFDFHQLFDLEVWCVFVLCGKICEFNGKCFGRCVPHYKSHVSQP